MAIKLEVEDYCQQCFDFTADVKVDPRIERVGKDEKAAVADTIIRCKYARRCASLTRYLERQLKQKELGLCETE